MGKESLIFLPGTLCDASLFEHQVKGLSDLVECRVMDTSTADTLTGVAHNILAQAPHRFILAGLSYGGIIAFEIMRQASEKVTKLILLNTNYQVPSEETRANQQRFIGMSFLGEFEKVTTDFLTRAMLHPEHYSIPEMREKVLTMALSVGKEGFYRQVKAQLARPDSTDDLRQINCPTLIISGKDDRLCPPALHEEMAELIPVAELHILKRCGHLSTLEQPELTTRIIRKWLEKQSKN